MLSDQDRPATVSITLPPGDDVEKSTESNLIFQTSTNSRVGFWRIFLFSDV